MTELRNVLDGLVRHLDQHPDAVVTDDSTRAIAERLLEPDLRRRGHGGVVTVTDDDDDEEQVLKWLADTL